jgi:hypothetical protein
VRGLDLSTQVLNEFTSRPAGLRSTGGRSRKPYGSFACWPGDHPVDLDTHSAAVDVAQRYGLSFYDASIVSSALKARCDVLPSEDMQHGLLIESRLRIENPFAAVAGQSNEPA